MGNIQNENYLHNKEDILYKLIVNSINDKSIKKLIIFNNECKINIINFKEIFTKINISFFKDFKNLYNITIPGDGHCFFHSVLKAINIYYNNISNILKQDYAIKLRFYLSLLIQEVDSNKKTNYEKMYGGNLSKLGFEFEEKSMKGLIKELNSNSHVDLIYQELLSDLFNIDIYVIDFYQNRIYYQDNEFLYKNRNSIIILYKNKHYELLGCYSPEDNNIYTVFCNNHELIIYLYKQTMQNIFK